MTPLLFLAGAAIVCLLFVGIATVRHRERRSSFESGIDKFRSDMDLLAPKDPKHGRRDDR
jgi:hypothetical protein